MELAAIIADKTTDLTHGILSPSLGKLVQHVTGCHICLCSHLKLVQILISEMFKVSDPPHRKSKKIKWPLLMNIKAIFGTFIVENNLFQSYPPKCGKFQIFLTVPLLLQISVATKIENGPKMNTKILRFLKIDRRQIRRIFVNSKIL